MTQKNIKIFITKFIPNDRKGILLQTKQTFTLLMTSGLLII